MRLGSYERALASGAAGALALTLTEPIGRALAGREPIYSARRIARRLAARAGLGLDQRRARWVGRLFQWTYAPALAVARALVVGRQRRPRFDRALVFGAVILASELAALPAIGATPPLRRWRPRELGALATHVMTFALAVELTA